MPFECQCQEPYFGNKCQYIYKCSRFCLNGHCKNNGKCEKCTNGLDGPDCDISYCNNSIMCQKRGLNILN